MSESLELNIKIEIIHEWFWIIIKIKKGYVLQQDLNKISIPNQIIYTFYLLKKLPK